MCALLQPERCSALVYTKFCCLTFLEIPIDRSQLQSWTRVRLPHGAAPFTLFYLSALLHNPVSIACSCFIGVSDAARAFWRMLDVMLIFTCAGASCYQEQHVALHCCCSHSFFSTQRSDCSTYHAA